MHSQNFNRYFPNELRLPRINLGELEENFEFTNAMKISPGLGDIKKALWFVPNFSHVLKGGLRTIFMLAEYLSVNRGTHNVIVIDNFYNQAVRDDLDSQLRDHFPRLDFSLVKFRYDDDLSSLPEADAGFCTLWVTAYTLARYKKCKAKFYFMQDYEPLFYTSGSISAVIEQTYRLGFYFIANTPGVASRFTQYSDWGMSFIPGVDTKLFYPLLTPVRKKSPYKIVFYGRPNNERNCFILGCESLRRVKERLGERVTILSVGAEFPEARYGVEGVIKNLGLLKTMEEVAALYRESDIGVSLMTTPHPSYQPLEYMASGCPGVTNINELNGWLYRNGENIVTCEPIFNVLAERIINTLEDYKLRQTVKEGGLETVSKFKWEDTLERIANYIQMPKRGVS